MTRDNKSRKLTFYFIALCLPVLVLGFIEVTLRLSGFGATYPLFVDASKPGYLTPNPELVKRYFHYGATTPAVSPDTYYFTAQKSDNTIRLVVMGGSSAAGFPYGRFGSPAGFLQQQLQSQYPDRNSEVISVAMSSINSYSLRDIVSEVAAISPDAVLIYAGHNEYLGILGAGSVYASYSSHLAKLGFLALNESRLFQGLQYLIRSDTVDDNDAASGRTVMALLAKNSNIELNSDTFQAGLSQFRSNLDAILTQFSDNAVPVLLSTIASNEKSLPPFDSAPVPGFSLSAFLQRDLQNDAVQQQARELIITNPGAADAHYALGQVLLSREPDKALAHLSQARDLDRLRFRAPAIFNDVIERAATRDGVFLADSLSALRADSPDGLLGSQHMLEHVHPTPRGYFVIAREFSKQLVNAGILPPPTVVVSEQQLWRQRPVSPVDALYGQYKIQRLTSDYPFTDTPQPLTVPEGNTLPEQLAFRRIQGESWLSQQPALLDYYQRQQQWHEAATVATVLATALPFEASAAHVAAQLSLRASRLSEAWYFARQAVGQDNANVNYHLTLAEALFRLDKKGDAMALLEKAAGQFKNDPRPAFFLEKVRASQ